MLLPPTVIVANVEIAKGATENRVVTAFLMAFENYSPVDVQLYTGMYSPSRTFITHRVPFQGLYSVQLLARIRLANFVRKL